MSRIEKRFALLLLAFPRHYRRARGAEMLTTLLDGAQPGQQWPSARTALSVVSSGIRCRLRLRPGKFSRIAAVMTTLAGVIFGATLGIWAAWNWTAGPLPSKAETEAIAQSILADEPHSRDRYDFLFGSHMSLGHGMPGSVVYIYDTYEKGQHIDARAVKFLRANGWAISIWPCRSCAGTIHVATKGGTRVIVTDSVLDFSRATPPAVPWFMLAGALLGAYGGWMLTARVGRLLARRNLVQKRALGALATAGFLLLLPALYYEFRWGILFYLAPELAPDAFARAPFLVFYWETWRDLTLAGLAAVLFTVAVAELPARRTPDVRRTGLHHPA
ncbi:hypothetical protein [Catelliglobosispora koreensis]|uniref:hypothetical protein n=1 Tax=Catelliglobosispora koreensis TaxID=129052 RepID=UPI00036C5F19|nr:hypothetical protein [Catelliglobosispora koreensis]